ncbi:MAG TPA: hypothetical protein VN428_02615 [Bryobacteraceae bacterium]|nr:hypothetical protein [Bryobacteraceae bacterium]
MNLSMFENFRTTERVGLQSRAEAVDALVSPTSGSFGHITTIGAGNTQRRITLGGRLSW